MAQFTVWYDEVYTYKMGFEAGSEDEALELLHQVYRGDLDINDLPEFWNKGKDYNIEIGLDTLEKVED